MFPPPNPLAGSNVDATTKKTRPAVRTIQSMICTDVTVAASPFNFIVDIFHRIPSSPPPTRNEKPEAPENSSRSLFYLYSS
jgi:hypothetical protein